MCGWAAEAGGDRRRSASRAIWILRRCGSGPSDPYSGEQRLSNYLLWQLAYTEFYFTEVPWPAFTKEELAKAIEKYNKRDRRYGGVKEE